MGRYTNDRGFNLLGEAAPVLTAWTLFVIGILYGIEKYSASKEKKIPAKVIKIMQTPYLQENKMQEKMYILFDTDNNEKTPEYVAEVNLEKKDKSPLFLVKVGEKKDLASWRGLFPTSKIVQLERE